MRLPPLLSTILSASPPLSYCLSPYLPVLFLRHRHAGIRVPALQRRSNAHKHACEHVASSPSATSPDRRIAFAPVLPRQGKAQDATEAVVEEEWVVEVSPLSGGGFKLLEPLNAGESGRPEHGVVVSAATRQSINAKVWSVQHGDEGMIYSVKSRSRQHTPEIGSILLPAIVRKVMSSPAQSAVVLMLLMRARTEEHESRFLGGLGFQDVC